MTVRELAKSMDASLHNTSQHLRLMTANNILMTRRTGNVVYYHIADNEIGEHCGSVLLRKEIKALIR